MPVTTTEELVKEARPASAKAQQALDSFARLLRFYASDAQLARALEWSEDTVRAWKQRSVARPRIDHREQVEALLEVCEEAARWVVDETDVGNWSLAPNDALRDAAPAAFAVRLGKSGSAQLLEIFPRVAPRIRVVEPMDLSDDDLEAIFASAAAAGGGEPIRPSENHEVDLSDFDD